MTTVSRPADKPAVYHYRKLSNIELRDLFRRVTEQEREGYALVTFLEQGGLWYAVLRIPLEEYESMNVEGKLGSQDP